MHDKYSRDAKNISCENTLRMLILNEAIFPVPYIHSTAYSSHSFSTPFVAAR